MKRSIFTKDFELYYPEGIQPCPMYVDIANKIYNALLVAAPYPKSDCKDIAINIAIYYEDKMSNIGLWNAFVDKHMQMYSRPLPFFDVDVEDLQRDDVNVEEVDLLLWLVLSRNHDDQFLNPMAGSRILADIIMDIILDADEVQENVGLYNYIYDKDKANDYFKLKHILLWLQRSYLIYSDLTEDFYNATLDVLEDNFNNEKAEYYASTRVSMYCEIGPLALLANLWLAQMYDNNNMHDEAKKLENVRYSTQELYMVTDADTEYATLTDALGGSYRMKNEYPKLLQVNNCVGTALVKYGDLDWEVNGVMFLANSSSFDNVRKQREMSRKEREIALPLYLKKTNGKQIAFFENKKQTIKWLKEITGMDDTKQFEKEMESNNYVTFITEQGSIAFSPGIVHAVKCDDNPYYRMCDEDDLQTEAITAVLDFVSVQPEVLQYLLKNNMLCDGDISCRTPSDSGKQIFFQNIDFIARNARRHKYHYNPEEEWREL